MRQDPITSVPPSTLPVVVCHCMDGSHSERRALRNDMLHMCTQVMQASYSPNIVVCGMINDIVLMRARKHRAISRSSVCSIVSDVKPSYCNTTARPWLCIVLFHTAASRARTPDSPACGLERRRWAGTGRWACSFRRP